MPQNLPQLAHRCLDLARRAGAQHAEVIVQKRIVRESQIENNDMHLNTFSEDITLGVRLISDQRLGFAVVNRDSTQALQSVVDTALAFARANAPDEHNVLPLPRTIPPLTGIYDTQLASITAEELAAMAHEMLARVLAIDKRINVRRGDFRVTEDETYITSTQGIAAEERATHAGAGLFGMAVAGNAVGSFDTDGFGVRSRKQLEHGWRAMTDRFAESVLACLGAQAGHTYRGPVIFGPKTVDAVLLHPIVLSLRGDFIRQGKSALAGKLGATVASEALTLRDEPRDAASPLSQAFDREGVPCRDLKLLVRGQVEGFLYNTYEAHAAGTTSTGSASGSATSLPSVGPANVTVAASRMPLDEMLQTESVILVGRFSGTVNPISGEMSGVAKNSFLLLRGARTPLKETMISGNVWELLKQIAAISRERQAFGPFAPRPWILVDGVSVTAG